MEVPAARERVCITLKERADRKRHPSSSGQQFEKIKFVFERKEVIHDQVAPECRGSVAGFVMEQLGPRLQRYVDIVMARLGSNFLMERRRQRCWNNVEVINHSQVLDYSTTRETVKRELSAWNVSESFIDEVLNKTRDKVESLMSTRYNVLIVHAKLDIEQDRFCSLADVANWMRRLTQSIDQDVRISSQTVPATGSWIESLEKKTMMDCGSCSICWDEFDDGCQTGCMPCSHVFHVDCIAEWLGINPSCPICRFEMSTS